MELDFRLIRGEELGRYVEELGRLRMEVFRDFPYLYEGDLTYEREYLARYLECERSLVVLIFDGVSLVGATTCLPMADEDEEFRGVFEAAGWEVGEVCYLGESILLEEYRGRGVGKEFFRLRHEHARRVGGMRWTVFCAVDRAEDDPRRPEGYVPLDGFWRRQGYEKRPELEASFPWREVGGGENEVMNRLTFWVRELE